MRVAYHIDGMPLRDYVFLPSVARAAINKKLDELIDRLNADAESARPKDSRR